MHRVRTDQRHRLHVHRDRHERHRRQCVEWPIELGHPGLDSSSLRVTSNDPSPTAPPVPPLGPGPSGVANDAKLLSVLPGRALDTLSGSATSRRPVRRDSVARRGATVELDGRRAQRCPRRRRRGHVERDRRRPPRRPGSSRSPLRVTAAVAPPTSTSRPARSSPTPSSPRSAPAARSASTPSPTTDIVADINGYVPAGVPTQCRCRAGRWRLVRAADRRRPVRQGSAARRRRRPSSSPSPAATASPPTPTR